MMAVSPDVGGVVRARAFAKRLECDLAIIDKRRPKANVSEVMNIIGDVSGPHLRDHGRHGRYRRHAVQGGQALKQHGAAGVIWPTARMPCCPASDQRIEPSPTSISWW
jgi:ribose-phosphate pyrophosphokinase